MVAHPFIFPERLGGHLPLTAKVFMNTHWPYNSVFYSNDEFHWTRPTSRLTPTLIKWLLYQIGHLPQYSMNILHNIIASIKICVERGSWCRSVWVHNKSARRCIFYKDDDNNNTSDDTDNYLAALCADEGPLSGVDPHVRRQLLRLTKWFTTDLQYRTKTAYSPLQAVNWLSFLWVFYSLFLKFHRWMNVTGSSRSQVTED